MKTGRLEAFSDGVLAIIITIMVLTLSVPNGNTFSSLMPLIPKFMAYLLSFMYVGIYWNNHHHLFQIIERVNGKILWANLGLLFFLSFIPFCTAWMGEHSYSKAPVVLYGVNLFLCALAFISMAKIAVKSEGNQSKLAKAIGKSWKENSSLILYLLGIGVAFYSTIISIALYYIVALIWLVPDTRIEKKLNEDNL